MSATILQFALRPRRDRGLGHEPPPRSLLRADDLVMDHADTAPCEYAPPFEQSPDEDTPA